MESYSIDIPINTENITALVGKSLEFCKHWLVKENIGFMDYYDTFSTCTSYFFNLKKELIKGVFSNDDMQKGFEIALNYPIVLPRLYLAFTFASSFGTTKHLKMVVKMLRADASPVMGFFLRSFAITCFPTTNELLPSFAFENYQEMLYLLEKLYKKFPKENDSLWLLMVSQNIAFCDIDNAETIQGLYNVSKSYNNKRILGNFIQNIVQTINESSDLKNFAFIFDEFESIDRMELIVQIFKRIKNTSQLFEFIKETKFGEKYCNEFIKSCLENNDIETIKKCAQKWKTYELHSYLLGKLGVQKYSEIAPTLPNGFDFTVEFISIVNSTIKPENIRRIISDELTKRSEILEKTLFSMMANNDFNAEFVQVVFADPFIFFYDKLLEIVINTLIKGKVKYEIIEHYLKRASSVNDPMILLDVAVAYDSFTYLEIFKNIPIQFVLSKIYFVSVSESSMENILENCSTKDEISSFCFVSYKKGFLNLVEKGIIKLLKLDEKCQHIDQQLRLYFYIINTILLLMKNDTSLLNMSSIVELIKDKIDEIFAICGNTFPIFTDEEAERYLNMLQHLNNFQFDFQKIISSLRFSSSF